MPIMFFAVRIQHRLFSPIRALPKCNGEAIGPSTPFGCIITSWASNEGFPQKHESARRQRSVRFPSCRPADVGQQRHFIFPGGVSG